MIRWTLLTTTLLVSMTGLAQAQAPPPDADWHRDWHHHRRYQKKEATTPSADNTVVKAGETRAIVDASGAAWTIVNGVVNRNGKPAGYSARVVQIAYVNGVVWQQNADRMWWAWDGSKWPGYGTSTSPLPASAAPATASADTTAAGAVARRAGDAPPSTKSAATAGSVPLPPVSCGSTTTNQFGILPVQQGGAKQIMDAKGHRFVPRGINVMNFGPGYVPSAARLQASFPGINFVRLAIYHYNSPQALARIVQDLTSHGIVVEIEDHNNGAGNAGGAQGSVATGQRLQSELAWYSSIASAFKNNPYVWFGTINEPPGPGPALDTWINQIYQAIRSTGNNSPILINPMGGGETSGMSPAVYQVMTNIIADVHYYGWVAHYSTDQAAVDQALAQEAGAARTLFNGAPVIVGEYGNSTTGHSIDANGNQVIAAVHGAVLSGTLAGSTAWAWGPGNPGDGLLSGSGLSSYGRQVASYLAQTAPGFSVCGGAAAVPTTTPSGGASVTVAPPQPASAAAAPTGAVNAAPLPASDPTIEPAYVQGASDAATAASQTLADVIAQGQARMHGK